jgi:hypothetical protein
MDILIAYRQEEMFSLDADYYQKGGEAEGDTTVRHEVEIPVASIGRGAAKRNGKGEESV